MSSSASNLTRVGVVHDLRSRPEQRVLDAAAQMLDESSDPDVTVAALAARARVAHVLGCEPKEVCFTGSGSEALAPSTWPGLAAVFFTLWRSQTASCGGRASRRS